MIKNILTFFCLRQERDALVYVFYQEWKQGEVSAEK